MQGIRSSRLVSSRPFDPPQGAWLQARRKSAASILITAAVLFCSSSSASAASPLPKLLVGGSLFKVRPPIAHLSNDATTYLGGRHGRPHRGDFGHLRWKSWGRHRARARGALWVGDCEPSCPGTY